jgi:site-specific recombinase XerD
MEQFVERVARFARGGLIETRRANFRQYRLFIFFLAERFAPEDIRNIQPRHVAAYISFRRTAGMSEKTILNDLSVIRWWHRRIPWGKYVIPDNAALFELEEKLDDKEFCAEIKGRCKVKKYLRDIRKPGGSVQKAGARSR